MAEATSEAEQLMNDFLAVSNEQAYSQLPDVVSESFVWETPAAPGGKVRGPDSAEDVVREVTGAFPDFEAELLDVLTNDDKGMAEVRFTMTHEGEYKGIPATGQDVELRAMSTWHVADRKLQELRDYANMQDLLEQLGVTADETHDPEGPTMATPTSTENEQLAREHFDRVWRQGEFDTDVLTDDYRVHTNLGGQETHTREEFQAFVEQAREAIPDLRKEPDDVVATDEKVTIRYTMTGTQEGEFEGIPATGDEVEINAIAIQRFEDGKIAEEWIVADFLRALKQLGVVD